MTRDGQAEGAVGRCRRLHGLEPGYVMGCDECEDVTPAVEPAPTQAERQCADTGQIEADDGQANDCRHLSATGIDTTPISDPAKVWRCDHCGLQWAAGRWADPELQAHVAAIADGGLAGQVRELVTQWDAEDRNDQTWAGDESRARNADLRALLPSGEETT